MKLSIVVVTTTVVFPFPCGSECVIVFIFLWVSGGGRVDFNDVLADKLAGTFEDLGPQHRRTLRSFLGDPRQLQQLLSEFGDERDRNRLCLLIRWLPIFESYEGFAALPLPTTEKPPTFCSLTGTHFYAPPSIDPRLLDVGVATFVQCKGPKDKALLDLIGVKSLPLSRFYRDFFLARLDSLPPSVRVNATVAMLADQTTLEAEDRGFIENLQHVAFVPAGVEDDQASESWGALHLARDLYDPLQSELQALLPRKAFPCREFCNPDNISKLRALGLRGVLTPEGE